ncbi:RidA family protein [Microlunatus sp. GCM10028923]|uniref:RidA family protein n=1 Tax=Microlunatus sp. GCM10028923 TaxID=3273400 RepID=UPI00360E23C1
MGEGAADRLAELGLTLPPVPAALAAYLPAVRTGELIFTAGQLPLVDGALSVVGRVGAEVTEEQAYDGARQAALNGIAAAAEAAGGLDRIAAVIKVVVYVAGVPEFTGQPKVANGASELIGAVFGDAGRHARSAVGVASLPLNAPVEVELVVRVVPDPPRIVPA